MVEKIVKKYFAHKKDIIAVYIYGSFASGTAGSHSDLDIALLRTSHKDRKENVEAKVRYQRELSDLLKRPVDIVFLRESGEILSYNILKNGRLVIEKDKTLHRSFTATRLIQCLDFHFLEQRMQQGMTAAMRRERHGQ